MVLHFHTHKTISVTCWYSQHNYEKQHRSLRSQDICLDSCLVINQVWLARCGQEWGCKGKGKGEARAFPCQKVWSCKSHPSSPQYHPLLPAHLKSETVFFLKLGQFPLKTVNTKQMPIPGGARAESFQVLRFKENKDCLFHLQISQYAFIYFVSILSPLFSWLFGWFYLFFLRDWSCLFGSLTRDLRQNGYFVPSLFPHAGSHGCLHLEC